jgi:16S rRNA processing protein RimM
VADNKGLISIGRITGTHGYKGIVKVEPLTDFPERFNDLKKVKLLKNNDLLELSIDYCREYKGWFLFKFIGIDSKEEAQQYRHARLVVYEDETYPLPEGVYYHYQLKGLAVHVVDKGYLGVLKDILETGANDVYVVILPTMAKCFFRYKRGCPKGGLEYGKMWVKCFPDWLTIRTEA